METCNGLVFHLGGVEINLVVSYYRNQLETELSAFLPNYDWGRLHLYHTFTLKNIDGTSF